MDLLTALASVVAESLPTGQSHDLIIATTITGIATVVVSVLSVFGTRTKVVPHSTEPQGDPAMDAVIAEISDLRAQRDALQRKLEKCQQENARLVQFCYSNGIDPNPPSVASRRE